MAPTILIFSSYFPHIFCVYGNRKQNTGKFLPIWKVERVPSKVGDFPGGPVVKNLPCYARDIGLTLVWLDPTCQGATKIVYHNY